MLSVNFFVVGLFSSIMRDMANLSSDSPKWIVLDGDIDPMWIESLNTVMDDNKVCVYYVRIRYMSLLWVRGYYESCEISKQKFVHIIAKERGPYQGSNYKKMFCECLR